MVLLKIAKFQPKTKTFLLKTEDEDSTVRSRAASALGKLGKTNNSIQPIITQWIEQHQDSENVGNAIDALWTIVEG
jgi:HEAT repeat protein